MVSQHYMKRVFLTLLLSHTHTHTHPLIYSHLFLQQDALQDLSACWGYEKNCDPGKRFSYPVCTKADSGWYCSSHHILTHLMFSLCLSQKFNAVYIIYFPRSPSSHPGRVRRSVIWRIANNSNLLFIGIEFTEPLFALVSQSKSVLIHIMHHWWAMKVLALLICLNLWSVRARSLQAAQELFWKQGDFGYVKERLSELKALCKASKPVSLLISLVPTGLLSQQEKTTGRNRPSVKQKTHRQ